MLPCSGGDPRRLPAYASADFYGIGVEFLWRMHFLWQKRRSFQAVGDST